MIFSTDMICSEFILAAVEYIPETGKFFWRERSAYFPKYKTFNSQFSGKEIKGFIGKDGYFYIDVSICGKKRRYPAHHIAWLIMTGAWPKNEIDHKNRIRNYNKFENLRE